MALGHSMEYLLGLPRGFFDMHGDWSVQFHPVWPGQAFLGGAVWNLAITLLLLVVVAYAYRNDGRPRQLRIFLGLMRAMLFALVLLLLNRPVFTLNQNRIEPSVLAIMIDDSSSMRVPDVGPPSHPDFRLAAAQNLFSSNNNALLTALSKKHDLRFFRFNRDAAALAEINDGSIGKGQLPTALSAIANVKAEGDSTQVLSSILTVARDLQGQRVAGVVALTDGRDTPTRNASSELDALKNYGVKVFAVAIGSDRPPKNIVVQSIQAEEVAFSGDVVNVKATVQASGFEPNHLVHLSLKDKKTNALLPSDDGTPAQFDIHLADDKPTQVELHWKTSEVGTKDVEVEAANQPGEIDQADNARAQLISVVDAKISVLYVDGSPRWDYRYLKNALLRDKTVAVSCLLAGADYDFLQEGNKPLPSSGKDIPGHFPDTLEQLMDYDVLVIGDVDPHYFSDSQLQLISEFVNRGGGLMMVAGERWTPQAYHNTPIEPLLPITLSHIEPTDPNSDITQGFRPILTSAGQATGIYRFFANNEINDHFLKNDIPELFWFCRGVTAKPSVGEVMAEHPTELGPDGHKAPLLVAGRFGGRTLFSAIDDSWRLRFYNDEHVFDSYWVQQLRFLARTHKSNQRHLTLSSDRPIYELGNQIQLLLRVNDPTLVRQLPDQISAHIKNAAGEAIRLQMLLRQNGSNGETFTGSFTADQTGRFTVQISSIIAGVDRLELPLEVSLPHLELVDPRVDRIQLSRLVSETFGKSIDLANAADELAAIPSAAKVLPVITGQPLWNAPISLLIFTLLISVEWITRKLHGMA